MQTNAHVIFQYFLLIVQTLATCALLARVLMGDGSPDCKPIKLSDEDFKQCGNKGFKIDCSGLRIQEVPDTYPPATEFPGQPLCVLDLSNNNIIRLRSHAFNSSSINASEIQFLYLQLNAMKNIEQFAFVGLSNLKYLNLSKNGLAWPEHNKSFSSLSELSSLEDLNLKCNTFHTFDGLDKVLQTLPNLKGLFILPTFSNVTYSFGSGFKNMNLTKLSVSESELCSCYLFCINNETFSNLKGLEKLYFSGCHVRNITPGAIQPLNQTLKELDMSRNTDLTFKGMNNALQGLDNSTTLQNLFVNFLHIRFERSIALTKDDMRYISTMKNLTNLYMDLNKIEVLEQEVLTPDLMIPPTLQTFTLAGNRLIYGKYTSYLENAENLTTIDVSRQFLGFDPFQFKQQELSSSNSYGDYISTSNIMDILTSHEDDRKYFVWDHAIKAHGEHESANVSIRKFDRTELFNKIHGFQVNCTCKGTNKKMCLPKNMKTLY